MKTYIEIQLCKQEVSVHTIRQTEETARRTHQKKHLHIRNCCLLRCSLAVADGHLLQYQATKPKIATDRFKKI